MENVIDAIERKSHIRFSAITGVILGIATFFFVGIPKDVIPNDKYMRMVPAGIIEPILLVVLSILIGVYAGTFIYVLLTNHILKNKKTMLSSVGKGTVGYFGANFAIACPICITWLVTVFGSTFLMKYYDPVRPFIGVLSMAIIGFGINHNISIIKGTCKTCVVPNKKIRKKVNKKR